MKRLLLTASLALALLPAAAQQYQAVPDHTVLGRIGTGSGSGPSQAIPFTTLLPSLLGTEAPNTVYAGPSSGSTHVTPAFRALVNADLPANPVFSSIASPSLMGGTAAGSTLTLESTSNGSPSGDALNLYGSTVTLGSSANGTQVITLGGPAGGGGVTVNIAGPGNGLSALNVYTPAGVKQQWISGGGNTTITFPDATDQLVGRATTDTLTNKTYDTAGTGNVFKINGTQITANTGTGNNVLATAPTISQPNLVGTTTNNNAAAGSVGEYVSSSVASGSAVSLTSSTAANVTSVSLTAGDWDCGGNVLFSPNASTTSSNEVAGLNTTSATLPTQPGGGSSAQNNSSFSAGAFQSLTIGTERFSLSATTTVYLVAQVSFGVSTDAAFGFLGCRRVR